MQSLSIPAPHQQALQNVTPTCSFHSSVAGSCYGTPSGDVILILLPSFLKSLSSGDVKRPVEIVRASTFPIDRVQIVDKWSVILVLSGSRLICVPLRTLRRESPDPCPNESATLSFAVDEPGDRLAIGAKKRITLVKRVSGLQGARFEPLHLLDLDSSPPISAHDICFAIENGHRWLCVCGPELTLWKDTEQQSHVSATAGPGNGGVSAVGPRLVSSSRSISGSAGSLPGADFLTTGRKKDEVLICRGSICTFTTPSQERSSVHFSSAVTQVVLLNPYIVGYLGVLNKVELKLDDDQLIHSLDAAAGPVSPSSVAFRWTVMPFRDAESHSRGIICCAGGDPRRRAWFRVATPLKTQVVALINLGKFASAMSLCRVLLRLDSQWDGSSLTDEDEGDSESDHRTLLSFYERSRFEYALSLLLTTPMCSVEEVNSASLLLSSFPPIAAEKYEEGVSNRLMRLLLSFADTDLFDSPESAKSTIASLVQSSLPSGGTSSQHYARFKPGGALGAAMRSVVVPVLLRFRQHLNHRDLPSDSVQAKVLDSILLRAFVLGRSGRNVSRDLTFDMQKRLFLQNNRCDIAESERLLLIFPEMWEDHAVLLAGKGEVEKGLEWLETLGRNAHETEVERYALASIRMIRDRPDLALRYARWMVDRCPSVGIRALVRFNCFESSSSSVGGTGKESVEHGENHTNVGPIRGNSGGSMKQQPVMDEVSSVLTRAKTFFESFSNIDELYQLYLEHLVFPPEDDDDEDDEDDDDDDFAREDDELLDPHPQETAYWTLRTAAIDELAEIYLETKNRHQFLTLVQAAGAILQNQPSLTTGGLNPVPSLERLLPRLDEWPREQAQVLDLVGRRKEAAFLLATRCSVEIAEEYAKQAHKHSKQDKLFDLILDGLLSSRPHPEEAVRFIVRNVDAIDVGRALRSLPDDLDLSACMEVARVALGDRDAGHRDNLVTKQLLRRENFLARERLARQKARYVIVGMNSPLCVGCHRTFKADSPMIVFRDQTWHYACYRQANPQV